MYGTDTPTYQPGQATGHASLRMPMKSTKTCSSDISFVTTTNNGL